MKKIMFFKSGRPCDAFVARGKIDPHSGRGSDNTVRCMFDLMRLSNVENKSEKYAFYGMSKRSEYDLKEDINHLQNYEDIVKFSPNIIMVDLGPDNEEFNKPVVDYINSKSESELYLFVYSLDQKFLKLKGVKRKYKVYTELDRQVDYLMPDIFYFRQMWLAWRQFECMWHMKWIFKTQIESMKPILIQCNENNQDYEHSRVKQIEKLCSKLPDVMFDVMGHYENQENINAINKIPNLRRFINDQYLNNELLFNFNQYDMAVIVKAINYVGGEESHKLIDYENNYHTFKELEYEESGVYWIEHKDNEETYEKIRKAFFNINNSEDPVEGGESALRFRLLKNFMLNARHLGVHINSFGFNVRNGK